jgi:hypothetical protein
MVDVDSWQTQLAFYGYHGERYDNDVYENSLPRLLDIFAKFGVKATFFIVGKHVSAGSNKILLKRLAAVGHELANHSMTHPAGFSRLSGRAKETEIRGCASALEDLTGRRVSGFRAPDYDIDEETIRILETDGYRYDSSLFPTSLAAPMRIAHYMLARGKGASTMGRFKLLFSPDHPYMPSPASLNKEGKSGITELPLTVTPFLRLPFYGTSVTAFGKWYFDMAFGMLSRSHFINYTLHAFETADATRDSVDKRLLHHPGIRRSLGEKKLLIETVLKRITERFNVMTAEEYVGGLYS